MCQRMYQRMCQWVCQWTSIPMDMLANMCGSHTLPTNARSDRYASEHKPKQSAPFESNENCHKNCGHTNKENLIAFPPSLSKNKQIYWFPKSMQKRCRICKLSDALSDALQITNLAMPIKARDRLLASGDGKFSSGPRLTGGRKDIGLTNRLKNRLRNRLANGLTRDSVKEVTQGSWADQRMETDMETLMKTESDSHRDSHRA